MPRTSQHHREIDTNNTRGLRSASWDEVLCGQAVEQWSNWGLVAPGVANGQSDIKFTKLEFGRPLDIAQQFEPDEGYTGLIQMVIFEVNDRGLIGYPTKDGHRYCCTKDLVSKTKCNLERLIVQVGTLTTQASPVAQAASNLSRNAFYATLFTFLKAYLLPKLASGQPAI